jgi:hypothetical protein
VKVTENYHGYRKGQGGIQMPQLGCMKVSILLCSRVLFPIIQIFLALRVQWAKSRSCAKRWSEEVMLLREEMRWVLAYFEYKSTWWEERETGQGHQVSPEIAEGLRFYAQCQAQLQQDIASQFLTMWAPL